MERMIAEHPEIKSDPAWQDPVNFYCSRKESKIILPHHAFHRFHISPIVLSVCLAAILIFYHTKYREIYQLPYGHTGVDAHRLHTGNFERPGIAKAYIALTGGSMYVYTQPSGGRFAFKERNVRVCLGVLHCYAKVKGSWLQNITLFRYLEMSNSIVLFGIQNGIIVYCQVFSEMHIV